MKPAAFLDRDGVICEYVDNLHRVEDFRLRPQVGEAIRRLNENGIWTFVITNQPMIAKGYLNLTELHNIHDKMRTELSKSGAILDDIQFCPHSPEGTVSPWNIECSCRKPKTGMITSLCSKFAIDLKKSFLVGDTWRDIQCAQSLNLVSYGVRGGAGFPYPKESPYFNIQPNFYVDSLWQAVELQLK